MKISSITAYRVRVPLKPDYQMISALGSHDASHYVIVRVDTDAGIHGAGEATVMPRWSGETAWSAAALIDHYLTPALLGHDPRDIDSIASTMDRIAVGNWFAKSAIEMACWDISGKAAEQPVYELLGGAVRSREIACRFSMGAYSAERAAERAKELVEQGFRTLKVKVGTGVKDDIDRVLAVRSAAPPEIDIVIDANCGYSTADQAIEAAQAMAAADVKLFEQPTPRDDFQAMADVRRGVPIAVMGDDACFDLNHAKLCQRFDACDVISVYPGKNGGIQKSQRIVEYCESEGIACSIGSNLELDIAAAAMCHLVISQRNMNIERYPGDILGPAYHALSLVKNPLDIRGPAITTPSSPGLGVEVDWERVRANAAAD